MGACILSDPRDDLIRRGDVLDMIDAESHGDEGLAVIDSRDILALPADPVAAAALALLEKSAKALAPRWEIFWDPGKYAAGGGCRVLRCQACNSTYRSPSQEEHADGCEWNAYRAALAGRERGR